MGLTVAFDIAGELRKPVIQPGFGLTREPTAGVLVPEATMHENRQSMPRQHEVRSAGEVALMKSEAKPERVDQTPDNEFGSGVVLADPTHLSAALKGREMVRHAVDLPCPAPRLHRSLYYSRRGRSA